MKTIQALVERGSRWASPAVLALATMICSALVPGGAGAAEIALEPGEVVVAGGGRVVLSIAVAHPAGDAAIRQVAAVVTGGDIESTFPALHDDGTLGDAVARDGRYSLETELPGPAGARSVTYYVVDETGSETVTEPLAFTFE
jgi:hypothetical protein